MKFVVRLMFLPPAFPPPAMPGSSIKVLSCGCPSGHRKPEPHNSMTSECGVEMEPTLSDREWHHSKVRSEDTYWVFSLCNIHMMFMIHNALTVEAG